MAKKRNQKPTIFLDARAIDFLPYGVGRYAREMATRLPALRPDWHWRILRHISAPPKEPWKLRTKVAHEFLIVLFSDAVPCTR